MIPILLNQTCLSTIDNVDAQDKNIIKNSECDIHVYSLQNLEKSNVLILLQTYIKLY